MWNVLLRPCGMVKLAPAGRSRCSRQEKKGSLFLSVWLTMAMKKTKTKTNTSSFPNKGKQWLLEIDLFNNQDAMQWVQFTDIVLHPMIQSSVTRLIFLSASLMGKNTSNRYKPSFQWGKKGRLVDICWSQILNLAPWEERDGYWRAVGGGLIKPPKEAPCVTDKTKILNTPQFKSFPPWTSQRGSACTEENFKTHWLKPYLFWNLWDGTQIFNAFQPAFWKYIKQDMNK